MYALGILSDSRSLIKRTNNKTNQQPPSSSSHFKFDSIFIVYRICSGKASSLHSLFQLSLMRENSKLHFYF